jgi:hypothetical protein
MRRVLSIAGTLVSVVLLTACPGPAPGPNQDLTAWKAKLEHVTPPASPPPLVRTVLNVAIRQGVPVACPALAAQAAPEYRTFVTATCASIVASNDPFTTTTQVLPALCAGSPPIGASVFPNLAPEITATCPLIMQLPTILKLTQYVPLF